jgi:Arc/MetJ family transcription regulator
MARMSITVEEKLLVEAQQVLGVSTKAEAIRIALREVVRRRHLHKVVSRRGKVDLELDDKTLERLRGEG